MRNLKIRKYLLETNINDNSQSVKQNENVIGAVLAFNTKIKEDDFNENGSFKNFNLISLLLFLDFRTGRIERYIINSSNPSLNLNRKNIGVDYKKDIYFTWNNEKFKVFHDLEHGPLTGKTILSEIGDGKLTRKYYIYFIGELLRDYFQFFGSFNNGNIASLRKNTLPLQPAVNNENGIMIKGALGVGKINTNEKENLNKLINESKIYKENDFEEFEAYKFINNKYGNLKPTSDNKWIVFIPNGLKNVVVDNWLNNFDYKTVYANKGELSQLVKDFSRTLSIKTVRNVDDINIRIRYFNHNIVRHLKIMGQEKGK